MAIGFDHVFVFCQPGAPEADAVAAAGLVEGAPNDHPGQGTACRRFFLDGAYLELLYLRDRAEALTEPAAMLQLPARAGGGCPIGIGLHHDPGDALPFATRPYAPAYLPPGVALPIARASDDAHQPLIFALPVPSRSTGPRFARIAIHGPCSPAVRDALAGIPKLVLVPAETWAVDLVLDETAPLVAVPTLPVRLAIG